MMRINQGDKASNFDRCNRGRPSDNPTGRGRGQTALQNTSAKPEFIEKRGRGRPRKTPNVNASIKPNPARVTKQGRGRPRKNLNVNHNHASVKDKPEPEIVEKQGRGRPRKIPNAPKGTDDLDKILPSPPPIMSLRKGQKRSRTSQINGNPLAITTDPSTSTSVSTPTTTGGLESSDSDCSSSIASSDAIEISGKGRTRKAGKKIVSEGKGLRKSRLERIRSPAKANLNNSNNNSSGLSSSSEHNSNQSAMWKIWKFSKSNKTRSTHKTKMPLADRTSTATTSTSTIRIRTKSKASSTPESTASSPNTSQILTLTPTSPIKSYPVQNHPVSKAILAQTSLKLSVATNGKTTEDLQNLKNSHSSVRMEMLRMKSIKNPRYSGFKFGYTPHLILDTMTYDRCRFFLVKWSQPSNARPLWEVADVVKIKCPKLVFDFYEKQRDIASTSSKI